MPAEAFEGAPPPPAAEKPAAPAPGGAPAPAAKEPSMSDVMGCLQRLEAALTRMADGAARPAPAAGAPPPQAPPARAPIVAASTTTSGTTQLAAGTGVTAEQAEAIKAGAERDVLLERVVGLEKLNKRREDMASFRSQLEPLGQVAVRMKRVEELYDKHGADAAKIHVEATIAATPPASRTFAARPLDTAASDDPAEVAAYAGKGADALAKARASADTFKGAGGAGVFGMPLKKWLELDDHGPGKLPA